MGSQQFWDQRRRNHQGFIIMIALTELWKYHQHRFGLYQQQGHQSLGNRNGYYGEIFRDLSLYQSGMQIKNIHWASFFKSNELLVKRFDQGQSGEIWFFLDQSPSCYKLNEGQTQSKFEYSKELILAICASAIGSGHRCRVFCSSLGLSKSIYHFESWMGLYQWIHAMKTADVDNHWVGWEEWLNKMPKKAIAVLLSDFFNYPHLKWIHPHVLYVILTHQSDFQVQEGIYYDDFEANENKYLFKVLMDQNQKNQLISDLKNHYLQLYATLDAQHLSYTELGIEKDLIEQHQKIIAMLSRFSHA